MDETRGNPMKTAICRWNGKRYPLVTEQPAAHVRQMQPISAQVHEEFQAAADLFNDAITGEALKHARQPDWPRTDSDGFAADMAALGV